MAVAEDVRDRIASHNQQFERAFRDRDAAAMARLYTRDAQLLPANTDAVPADRIASFWDGVMKLGITDVTLQTLEVESHGDTAIEVGRYRLTGSNGAEADSGKYLVVWKQDVDGWKLHRDIWTTSRPAE